MKINIFGSTGIIGTTSLDIIKKYFPKIKVNLLCANDNIDKLLEQINVYSPKYVFLNNQSKHKYLKANIDKKIKILNYEDLIFYLNNSKSDLSLLAISGYKSLNYFESIINNTSSLGLVSKEAVVSAGHLFKGLKKLQQNKIFPLDSEHFSIFKNLNKDKIKIKNITLTASGGPFLGKKYKFLKEISFAQASNHPKWKMGYKNSIDSATLVNKCLELIEAHYLFNISYENLKIVIHPESIIHSIFEYENYLYNMIGFQNDMTIPLFHFLNQEFKYILKNNKFEILSNKNFHFYDIQDNEFPVYKFFRELDKTKPSNIIKFNVANEFAVNLFKKKCIKYTDIFKIITKITSLNYDYKLNNIKDIIKYHELLEIKINETYSYK